MILTPLRKLVLFVYGWSDKVTTSMSVEGSEG